MLKLRIVSIGKTKEKWLDDAIGEYLKRLKPLLDIQFVWTKDNAELIGLVQKEKHLICLDPNGRLLDSKTFSTFLMQQFEQGGARLAIAIGGPDGLPKELKENFPLISFSPMTFTHQLTRLILMEQLYRAFEIAKGSKYHK